jgi:hypothetical protein
VDVDRSVALALGTPAVVDGGRLLHHHVPRNLARNLDEISAALAVRVAEAKILIADSADENGRTARIALRHAVSPRTMIVELASR